VTFMASIMEFAEARLAFTHTAEPPRAEAWPLPQKDTAWRETDQNG
jgi:hypothetical protein